MVKLLEMMARSCDSLLLFTQNVKKVSVYHLLDHHEPHQANLLFSVNKDPVKYLSKYETLHTSPISLIYAVIVVICNWCELALVSAIL